jgi:hypothetical protein
MDPVHGNPCLGTRLPTVRSDADSRELSVVRALGAGRQTNLGRQHTVQ